MHLVLYVGICPIYIRIFMICNCISVSTFSLGGAGFCLKRIFSSDIVS